jgi:hypothetical protein
VIDRARIFPVFAAIALVAAASGGARGALAADQPAPAEQTYFNTLAVMHAIPNPPFLRFGFHFEQVATGAPDHQEDWHAVERTEDGRTSLKDDRGKDRPEGGAERGRPFYYIRPDLFLKPSAAPSPQQFGIVTDTPYKVIGSTRTATHYVITGASGDVVDCPGATHLRLRPKAGADPFYYNLRELWITPASGRICKAIAVWNAGLYYWHRISVEFTLDVDAETSLIQRWSAGGVARSGPFQSRYRIDARYANVTAERSTPAGLFNY